MAVLGEELEEIGLPIGFYDVLVQLNRSRARRPADGRSRPPRPSLQERPDPAGRSDGARRAWSVAGPPPRMVAATTSSPPRPSDRNALRRASPGHLRGVANHFTSLLTDDELKVITKTMNRVADAVPDRPRRRGALSGLASARPRHCLMATQSGPRNFRVIQPNHRYRTDEFSGARTFHLSM